MKNFTGWLSEKFDKLNISLSARLLIFLCTSTLFFGTLGYFLIISQVNSGLEKIVSSSTPNIAELIMDWFDEEVSDQIYYWKSFSNDREIKSIIAQSNHQFDLFKDVDALIKQRDSQWIANSSSLSTEAWYREIFENQGSKKLIDLLAFGDPRKTTNFGVAELFVTNRYGVNVLESGRTTDYLQSDEVWWQEATKTGVYVGGVEHDASSGKYSFPVGLRINDSSGNLIGVTKIVFDLSSTERLVRDMVLHRIEEVGGSSGLSGGKLIDSDGNLIFDIAGLPYNDAYRLAILDLNGRQKVLSRFNDPISNNLFLISIARSSPKGDNPGMNWSLVLENNTKILFSPTREILRALRYIILFALIAILLIGVFITRVFKKEFEKIEIFISKIANGDYRERLKISSKNEFSQLANHFNQMIDSLQKNEESRDEFNSVAVHQLKSPLTALKWNLELLLQGNLGPLSPEVEKRSKEIHSVVVQLITTVSDLLRVFKLDHNNNSRQESDVPKLKINASIFEIVKSLDILMKTKSLVVTQELSPENIEAKISYEMFKEIIDNLLTNAFKYSFNHGEINLKTTLEGRYAVISIQDSGIGIPEAEQDHVFEKFFRGSNATRQKIEGSGLGLYIARSNARHWGGDITFTSNEGQGTTFFLRLPLA